MALDEIIPGADTVIISVYGGWGFGIRAVPGDGGAAVGTVYKIGYNVYNVAVDNKVGFKTDVFFATNDNLTFASVPKENVSIVYEPIP